MNSKRPILPDILIILPIIFLLSLGILVIYSSDLRLAIQQLVFALIGLIIFWFLSQVELESYRPYTKYLYFLMMFLLVVVFILGAETRGSTRWIQIFGLKFQPSEFAKPILILALANFWSSKFPSWKNIFLSFLIILPTIILIFRQPDLGTVLTILAIWLFMLIGANLSIVKLGLMGLASFILSPLIWFSLKDYQKDRILSFLSPTHDPLGVGYNVIQSMIAVGSGEFWGRGLGRGTQSRLQFLPEFRTDFIFASIAEEFGFFVCVLVLILYGLLIGKGFGILNQAGSRFSSLVIIGVLGMLFFQIVVNIGMNVGILPITGITLPLLSYGGSSLVSTLICLSFLSSAEKLKRNQRILG